MVTYTKPIVYGNVAHALGKAADQSKTHNWTIYIRSPTHDDLSGIISKVEFKLHESFADPVRVIKKQPFEVSESGWGEFEVQIKLFFTGKHEKPITLQHLLKLYPTDYTVQLSKKTLAAENYDELVFQNPGAPLRDALAAKPTPLGGRRHNYRDYEAEEDKQLEQLKAIKTKLRHNHRDLETKYQAALERVQGLKDDLKAREQAS